MLRGRLTMRRVPTVRGGTEDRLYMEGESLDSRLEDAFLRLDKLEDPADDCEHEWSAGIVALTIEITDD